jgi:hypothetical protein
MNAMPFSRYFSLWEAKQIELLLEGKKNGILTNKYLFWFVFWFIDSFIGFRTSLSLIQETLRDEELKGIARNSLNSRLVLSTVFSVEPFISSSFQIYGYDPTNDELSLESKMNEECKECSQDRNSTHSHFWMLEMQQKQLLSRFEQPVCMFFPYIIISVFKKFLSLSNHWSCHGCLLSSL